MILALQITITLQRLKIVQRHSNNQNECRIYCKMTNHFTVTKILLKFLYTIYLCVLKNLLRAFMFYCVFECLDYSHLIVILTRKIRMNSLN